MKKFLFSIFLICTLTLNVFAENKFLDSKIEEVTAQVKSQSISATNAKFMFEQWQKNAFADIASEKLNIIYKLCVDNVKKFKFVKYFGLSKERRTKLSPQTQKILKNKSFCLLLLCMGYCQKNAFAINYAASIKNTALEKYFMDQVKIFQIKHEKRQATQLFSRDSRNKYNLLLKILNDKDGLENYYKNFKIITLTEDEEFIAQLKSQKEYKNKILKKCRQLTKKLRKKRHEKLRTETLSDLYSALASDRELLDWYLLLQKSTNISKSERETIKKRIDILKQKLNLH